MEYIKRAEERKEVVDTAVQAAVTEIINNVRTKGDAALREYNERFDQNTRECLRVSREEIEAAYRKMAPEDLADGVSPRASRRQRPHERTQLSLKAPPGAGRRGRPASPGRHAT